VLLIGSEPAFSAEFCGGTHLTRTGQIGLLKIVSEESVAKGVRRITAVTGRGAMKLVQEMDGILHELTGLLRTSPASFAERVAAMQKEIKELRKARTSAPAAAVAAEFRPDVTLSSPHGAVLVGSFPTVDPNAMRAECDRQRQKGSAAVLLGAEGDGKVMLVAMVSDALAAGGVFTADKWVRAVGPLVGGGGGGRPTLAQAGGKDPRKLPEALSAAAEWARANLT